MLYRTAALRRGLFLREKGVIPTKYDMHFERKDAKMNLKKQLKRILLLEGLSNFTLASTAWVVLLTARGFSLAEVGMAEAVFHAVSLCCEVPSGMVADLLGRKRTLAAGRITALLSALAMILSTGTIGVYVGMALSALSYNLASGTREAITYDSLLQHGEEPRYLRFSSSMNLVYRLTGAAVLLCAGFTAAIGYRAAYALDMLVHLGAVCVCLSLAEPAATAAQAERPRLKLRDMPGAVGACAADAWTLLREQPRLFGLMLFNAVVGAAATLLGFILQGRLYADGAGAGLGPLLLVAALGGAAGSKLAPWLGRLRYGVAATLSVAGVACGIALVLSGQYVLMALGGFLVATMDDALQLVSDNLLNGRIPSDRRATLVSVSSMTFSLVMVLLSPWIGQFS